MRRVVILVLALLLAGAAAFFVAAKGRTFLAEIFKPRSDIVYVLYAKRNMEKWHPIDRIQDVQFRSWDRTEKGPPPLGAVVAYDDKHFNDAMSAASVSFASTPIPKGAVIIANMVRPDVPAPPKPVGACGTPGAMPCAPEGSPLDALVSKSKMTLLQLRSDPEVSIFTPEQALEAILDGADKVDIYVERPQSMVTAWSAAAYDSIAKDVPFNLVRVYSKGDPIADGAQLPPAPGAGSMKSSAPGDAYSETTLAYVRTNAATAARIDAIMTEEAQCLDAADQAVIGDTAAFVQRRFALDKAAVLPPGPDLTPTKGEKDPSASEDYGSGDAKGAGNGNGNGASTPTPPAPAGKAEASAPPCRAPRVVVRPAGAGVALGYGDGKVCSAGHCFELSRPSKLEEALQPVGNPQVVKAPKPAALGPAQRVFNPGEKYLSKQQQGSGFGSTNNGGSNNGTGSFNGTGTGTGYGGMTGTTGSTGTGEGL